MESQLLRKAKERFGRVSITISRSGATGNRANLPGVEVYASNAVVASVCDVSVGSGMGRERESVATLVSLHLFPHTQLTG